MSRSLYTRPTVRRWALEHSAFAHFDASLHTSHESWRATLREQGPDAAAKMLPAERPYPVPPSIAARIGMGTDQ